MVEVYGMGGETTGLRVSRSPRDGKRVDGLSPAQEEAIDRQVNDLLAEAQARAARILREHRDQLEALRALLLEKKTIEAKALGELLPAAPGRKSDGAVPDLAEG
jgi:cell division protease FtsH